MPLRIFILEDDPTRMIMFREALVGAIVEHAVDVTEAKRILESCPPFDIFLLDHDLGGEQFVSEYVQNTGSGFCRLPEAQEAMKDKKVVIHSYNPDGAVNMNKLIPHALRMPFGLNLCQQLQRLVQNA